VVVSSSLSWARTVSSRITRGYGEKRKTVFLRRGRTVHVGDVSTINLVGLGKMAAAIGSPAAKAAHTVEVMNPDAAEARALAKKVGVGATTGTFGAVPAGEMILLPE
jgi:hypothetical protein